MFGTWFGVIVFLLLLLFTVQTLANLYANSVVTSEAYAAVRTVAGHDAGDDRAAAADAATERFRADLGRVGDDADLVFLDLGDPDVIRAQRHRAPSPPPARGDGDRAVRRGRSGDRGAGGADQVNRHRRTDRPHRTDRSRRLRGESGQVAGIEVIPFGFLLLVVVTLLVVNAWAVVQTKLRGRRGGPRGGPGLCRGRRPGRRRSRSGGRCILGAGRPRRRPGPSPPRSGRGRGVRPLRPSALHGELRDRRHPRALDRRARRHDRLVDPQRDDRRLPHVAPRRRSVLVIGGPAPSRPRRASTARCCC